MVGEHIARFGEDVLDVRGLHQTEPHFSIDSAESQIVDFTPKRWDIGPLAGIKFYGDHVVGVPFDMGREIERKGRVSALVFAYSFAIDPHGGGGHGSVEIDEDLPATRIAGKAEPAA